MKHNNLAAKSNQVEQNVEEEAIAKFNVGDTVDYIGRDKSKQGRYEIKFASEPYIWVYKPGAYFVGHTRDFKLGDSEPYQFIEPTPQISEQNEAADEVPEAILPQIEKAPFVNPNATFKSGDRVFYTGKDLSMHKFEYYEVVEDDDGDMFKYQIPNTENRAWGKVAEFQALIYIGSIESHSS